MDGLLDLVVLLSEEVPVGAVLSPEMSREERHQIIIQSRKKTVRWTPGALTLSKIDPPVLSKTDPPCLSALRN